MISTENNKLDYPIYIEIPEDYWVYSFTNSKEYSKESKEK